MTAKVMVSFTNEFLEEVDRTAQEEHRSRSELVQEALRLYMGLRQEQRLPGLAPLAHQAVMVQDRASDAALLAARIARPTSGAGARPADERASGARYAGDHQMVPAGRYLGRTGPGPAGRLPRASNPALVPSLLANVLRYKGALITAQVEEGRAQADANLDAVLSELGFGGRQQG